MRDLVKLLLIPIAGCIAIGVIFLLIVYGGMFDRALDKQENERGIVGSATAQLRTVDGIVTTTPQCDPTMYQPVCGFDGVSYDNVCFALKAGTRVAHQGVCA